LTFTVASSSVPFIELFFAFDDTASPLGKFSQTAQALRIARKALPGLLFNRVAIKSA